MNKEKELDMNDLIRDFNEYSTDYTKSACRYYEDYLINYQKEKLDLQEKLDKILTYAKDRCDDYLKEDDCEYCDGVFASCRKVLQLAGEDISEYE